MDEGSCILDGCAPAEAFLVVVIIVLVLLVMSGVFTRKNIHGAKDRINTGGRDLLLSVEEYDPDLGDDGSVSYAQAFPLSIISEEIVVNESSQGSQLQAYSSAIGAGISEENTMKYEVRLDVDNEKEKEEKNEADNDREFVSARSNFEKVIIVDDSMTFDGQHEEDLEEFNKRVESFIKRVRMGFCMER